MMTDAEYKELKEKLRAEELRRYELAEATQVLNHYEEDIEYIEDSYMSKNPYVDIIDVAVYYTVAVSNCDGHSELDRREMEVTLSLNELKEILLKKADAVRATIKSLQEE